MSSDQRGEARGGGGLSRRPTIAANRAEEMMAAGCLQLWRVSVVAALRNKQQGLEEAARGGEGREGATLYDDDYRSVARQTALSDAHAHREGGDGKRRQAVACDRERNRQQYRGAGPWLSEVGGKSERFCSGIPAAGQAQVEGGRSGS